VVTQEDSVIMEVEEVNQLLRKGVLVNSLKVGVLVNPSEVEVAEGSIRLVVVVEGVVEIIL
jgi:hypothetical protein